MQPTQPITIPTLLKQLIQETTKSKIVDSNLYERILLIFKKSDFYFYQHLVNHDNIINLKSLIDNQRPDNRNLIRFFCTEIVSCCESYNYLHQPRSQPTLEDPPPSDLKIVPFKYEHLAQFFLPTDVLHSIFLYVIKDKPSWQTLGKFALTNTQFYRIAIAPSSLKTLLSCAPLNEIGMSKNFAAKNLIKKLARFDQISIDFSDRTRLIGKNVELLFCPKSYLKFKFQEIGEPSNRVFLNDKRIKMLADHSPKLQTLCLYGAEQLTNDSIFYLASRCSNLRSITIVNNQKISEDALIALSACCPKLTKISFTGCESGKSISCIEDDNKTPLAAIQQVEIQKMDPLFKGLFDRWLLFLAETKHQIHKLELNRISAGNTAFAQFAQCSTQQLKQLFLTSTRFLTPESLLNLENCQEMQQIKLIDPLFNLKDQDLQMLTKKWRRLRNAAVHNCSSLTAKGIENLITGCPTLEKLTLDNFIIKTETLTRLLLRGITLTELRIDSSCNWLISPSDFIQKLIENKNQFPMLQTLHLGVSPNKISSEERGKLKNSFQDLKFTTSKFMKNDS